jgi:hypothetical protein
VAAPLLALVLPLELRVVVPFELKLELAPPLSSWEALDSSSEQQPLETGPLRPPLLSSSLLPVEATFWLFFDLTFLLFFWAYSLES